MSQEISHANFEEKEVELTPEELEEVNGGLINPPEFFRRPRPCPIGIPVTFPIGIITPNQLFQ